jgi:hypothetical protein
LLSTLDSYPVWRPECNAADGVGRAQSAAAD